MPPERRTPTRPPATTGRSGPPARAGVGARGPAGRGAPERGGGYGDRGGGSRAGFAGGRRDVTEKGEKPIYFSQLNFDETSNDFLMTKATIGMGIAIILFGVATFLFNLGINCIIGFLIALALWIFYFVTSLIKRPKMPTMSYKEKKGYWTYELTDEYRQRNVALNEFKRFIAQDLLRDDKKVLIDDVSVEMVSYSPLIFDFAIRAKVDAKKIKNSVPQWCGKFECETGTVTKTGITSWRVVYPREGKWQTLAGKKITPADAIGETHEPSIECNPIGIRTDTFQELWIDNSETHTIITGQSGYGKSNMFNMILVNQFPTDAIILFFDAKGVEAPATAARCFPVTCFEQANAWADAILDDMSPNGRRKRKQDSEGKKKFLPAGKAAHDPDALPFSPDFPPIIVAVDECSSWVNKTGTNGQSARMFENFLTQIAQKGRSFGITLLVATQTPRDKNIPEEVKNQANQFIAFQQPSAHEAQAFGNKGIDYKATAPSDIPIGANGIGQFSFASGTTGEGDLAVPAKGYYITADEVKSQAAMYANKKRLNNPVVQNAIANYEKIYAAAKNKRDLPTSLV